MYHPFDPGLSKFGGDLVVECLFGGLDDEISSVLGLQSAPMLARSCSRGFDIHCV